MITKLPSFATSNKISSSMMICHDSVIGNVHEEIVVSQRDNFSRIVLNNLHYPQFDRMNDLFEIGTVKDNEDCKIIGAVLQSITTNEEEINYNVTYAKNEMNETGTNDIGYDMNGERTTFVINVPRAGFVEFDICNWDYVRFVAAGEIVVEYVPIRELCKILFEFFEPIRDGRLNWK